MQIEQPQLQEVSSKLDTLIRLFALSLIEGKLQKDQIAVLARARLSRQEIASLVNTTPNTVSVALSKGKRANRGGTV